VGVEVSALLWKICCTLSYAVVFGGEGRCGAALLWKILMHTFIRCDVRRW